MKINYHDEDCSESLFQIIIFVSVFLFLIVWFVSNGGDAIDVSYLIFIGICSTFIIIMFAFSLKKYLKIRKKRNLNLFIMKNGKIIQGKVINIYDNKTSGNLDNNKIIHNVTANVEYYLDNERKVIAVDNLAININKMNDYINKSVKIFVYTNMNYIDIVN